MTCTKTPPRLPSWFRTSLTTSPRFIKVRNSVTQGGLHTVCQSAACPNRNECWNAGTAAFMILGDRCTRNCGFCNIAHGTPGPVDREEPHRIAQAVARLGLQYAVVTSVTRDDLADGGAEQFAETVRAVRRSAPGCRIEALIPDFQGSAEALATVLDARPDVLNHNIETVPSLYALVRPKADFLRSIGVLASSIQRGFITKTGMMLGLGEDLIEVRETLEDIRKTGCSRITLGQYLQPRKDLLPVARFYAPEEFRTLGVECRSMGFLSVHSGPLVRSSYRAADRA